MFNVKTGDVFVITDTQHKYYGKRIKAYNDYDKDTPCIGGYVYGERVIIGKEYLRLDNAYSGEVDSKYTGVTFKENASKPDVKPPSFQFRFLVTTLLYILLVLFPVHVGFGVDVKQLWAIILPTVIFGLIFSRAVTR